MQQRQRIKRLDIFPNPDNYVYVIKAEVEFNLYMRDILLSKSQSVIHDLINQISVEDILIENMVGLA